MSLFAKIAQLSSRKGDRISFEVSFLGNNEIRVMATPDLGPTPSNATDEEVELRAALASPLTITGTPEEVDTLLTEHLMRRQAVQREGVTALASLEARIKQASEKAGKADPTKAATKTAKATKSATAAAPADPVPEKAPTLEDSF